jgi:hypothetical protein
MKFPALKKIILRLYNFYVKEHLGKILLALFLSFGVAGGTAAIAWLLDPAVKKIFIDQDKTMMLLLPLCRQRLQKTEKEQAVFYPNVLLHKNYIILV